jgi:hypothetical protein
VTEGGQFLALLLSESHVNHPWYLRLSEAAQTMPIF